MTTQPKEMSPNISMSNPENFGLDDNPEIFKNLKIKKENLFVKKMYGEGKNIITKNIELISSIPSEKDIQAIKGENREQEDKDFYNNFFVPLFSKASFYLNSMVLAEEFREDKDVEENLKNFIKIIKSAQKDYLKCKNEFSERAKKLGIRTELLTEVNNDIKSVEIKKGFIKNYQPLLSKIKVIEELKKKLFFS